MDLSEGVAEFEKRCVEQKLAPSKLWRDLIADWKERGKELERLRGIDLATVYNAEDDGDD